MQRDQSEVGNMEVLLSKLGESLDDFLTFKHDDALQSRSHWLEKLDTDMPEKGIGAEAVVQLLCDEVIPFGSPVPKPGFTSFITSGAVSVSAVAQTAASIASPQRNLLSAFHTLEEVSLNWLRDLCGLPQDMKGIYSSGGSVANLVALGGARQAAFEKIGVDPAADGFKQSTRIYASDQAHHTIKRSAGVLGLGRNSVMAVVTDQQGRIDPVVLEQHIIRDLEQNYLPVAIVANAGTTNTGSIDNLELLGKIAKKYDIWYHVDGAYGLPGILDNRVKDLYKGLELCDSAIVDPHKWLGAPVGVAATFVRDRGILHRAFTQEPADYLEGSASTSDVRHSLDDFGVPYFDFGVELSSPPRGVILWAMLKEIGATGMAERIKRHNDLARLVASEARKHDHLELLQEPTLSICCFRYTDPDIADLDELNSMIHRQLIFENEYLPSTTQVAGSLAIRPCFIGARTLEQHATGLVEAVLRIGKTIVDQ